MGHRGERRGKQGGGERESESERRGFGREGERGREGEGGKGRREGHQEKTVEKFEPHGSKLAIFKK